MIGKSWSRCCLLGGIAFALGLVPACESVRQTPPPAQPSAQADPTAIVRVQKGASFTAACLTVDAGATVEWRNLTPSTSIIVLSTAAPYELSSPSLMMPYDIVPPEMSDECTTRTAGNCDVPLAYSYWRHTFNNSGVFDYLDQAGSQATTSSGSYSYGMPPGPQATASANVGTVCVRGDGQDCLQVCCVSTETNACEKGVTCVGSRCGGVVQ